MKSRHHIVLVTAMLAVACGSGQLKKVADSGAKDAPGEDVRGTTNDTASVRDGRVDEPSLAPDLPNTFDLPAADAPKSEDLPFDQRPLDADAADLGPDTALDATTACTPGVNQTCNDSLLVSSIWGTCTAAGTCVCNDGFVVNPATGRCMPVPKNDASVDQGGGVCQGEFAACGCGCCGDPRNTACYYPTVGETLDAIKAADAQSRATTNCTLAGCAAGTRYVCCVPAAPESQAASYAADSWPGGLDHLTIAKRGADCATLSLARPAQPRAGFRIDTGGTWALTLASFGPCVDAGVLGTAQGGLGTVFLHTVASTCVADVHVTLFGFTSTGTMKTSRLDADGVAVTGMTGSCR